MKEKLTKEKFTDSVKKVLDGDKTLEQILLSVLSEGGQKKCLKK